MLTRITLLVVLCALPVLAYAQTTTMVQIDTDDAPALAAYLYGRGFDVVEGSIREGALDVVASPTELAQLEELGLQMFIVRVGRPFEQIQREWDVPPLYKDLAEVLAEMQAAAANFPSICKFVDLTAAYGAPETFEGRHMYAVKISDNAQIDEDEPAFLVVSTHHAREIVTPVIALYAIERFTQDYGTDPRITALVDENEIWIAPIWNPDGYNWVFVGDDMWRKNRRVFSGGTGVDQNRNYPFGWDNPCSGSTSPSSETYKGPEPASEAETQTMLLWSEERMFDKIIDFHSSGRETLYGYDCWNHPFDNFLRDEAVKISTASGYGGDVRGPSADGEHYQWQLGVKGAYGFLTETATQFQPSYSEAEYEAQLVFPSIPWMLERPIPLSGVVTERGTGLPLEAKIELLGVSFENGETNYSNPRFGRYHVFAPPGNYDVKFSIPDYEPEIRNVTITANTAQIVNVELAPPSGMRVRPHDDFHSQGPWGGPFTPGQKEYTVENLDPDPIDYQVTKGESWVELGNASGSIPAYGSVVVTVSIGAAANTLPNGNHTDTVDFVNLTNHDGDTSRGVLLEVGVPSVQYSWNMDADPGWTTEAEWAWGQPTGQGGAYGNPDPTSGHTGGNVCGYNLNGDYSNNMPERHLTTDAIDCSKLDNVSLRFWRWLGVERSQYDNAVVRASNDGTNWTTVWHNPDEETADAQWTYQEFDISLVADKQPTVYLRWTMGATDGGWTYCGWNIDDVEIWGLGPGGPVYPLGDLNCDTQVDFGDINPFVLALTSPAGYAAAFPDCDIMNGDINEDGKVDFGDINPFVRLLTNP